MLDRWSLLANHRIVQIGLTLSAYESGEFISPEGAREMLGDLAAAELRGTEPHGWVRALMLALARRAVLSLAASEPACDRTIHPCLPPSGGAASGSATIEAIVQRFVADEDLPEQQQSVGRSSDDEMSKSGYVWRGNRDASISSFPGPRHVMAGAPCYTVNDP